MVDRLKNRRQWRVALAAVVLAGIGVEAAIIVSQVSDGAAFTTLHWDWLALATAAEIVSVGALGALYRPLLSAGGVAVGPGRGLALGAAASAITATVPAGAAVSSGYLFGQFRRAGSSAAGAAWAVLIAAALSVVGFGAVVAAGAALGADDWVDSVWHLGAVGVAAGLIVVGTSTVLLRRPGLLIAAVRPLYRLLPGGPGRRSAREEKLAVGLAQLTTIRPSAGHWLRAFAFATLTWAADLATFLFSLQAVGVHHLGIGAATLAYGAGLATTSISVIPAGVGAVEAGMLLGLTSAGVTGAVAVAGIVTYRVIAYILVAGAGWLVWAVLRRGDRAAVAPPAPLASYADARDGRLAA